MSGNLVGSFFGRLISRSQETWHLEKSSQLDRESIQFFFVEVEGTMKIRSTTSIFVLEFCL